MNNLGWICIFAGHPVEIRYRRNKKRKIEKYQIQELFKDFFQGLSFASKRRLLSVMSYFHLVVHNVEHTVEFHIFHFGGTQSL